MLQKIFRKHSDYYESWQKAMATGLMTGRPFSKATMAYYTYYVEKFLHKHRYVSFKTLQQELLEIPIEQFGKRYKLYKALVCFAKYLIRERALSESFLEEARKIQPKRHKPPKRETVSEEALSKLIAATKTPFERLLVLLLSSTGLRISEACALTLGDIDFSKQVLTVQCGKGGKRRRVGLSNVVIQALQVYLNTRASLRPNSAVFVDAHGEPINRFGLYQRLTRIGKAAGVHVTPHALRRAFVTLNVNKGRPLVHLQIACGHSDIKTTRSYCQTTEDEVIDAMKEWD